MVSVYVSTHVFKFPVNTILAWIINSYHEQGDMVITSLLLPPRHISSSGAVVSDPPKDDQLAMAIGRDGSFSHIFWRWRKSGRDILVLDWCFSEPGCTQCLRWSTLKGFGPLDFGIRWSRWWFGSAFSCFHRGSRLFFKKEDYRQPLHQNDACNHLY